ncbi:putative sulfate exporter family transporter [Aquincola sp. S2]|uniref:Sulfate exporter family transporter n=1 Tax=Pseudaquabacterium terrae TaxID=2732868 RepID=A0ABX2ETW5_9BURK|nr:putative sulfate exporter family transporter [Aquabacterium terrae]NRF71984.1 putative sulfate exporter family transporter [Aquabacterium terrae]
MASNAPSSTSDAGLVAWLLSLQRHWPGIALCAALAAAATFVAGLHRGPVMLYALLFGTAFHYQSEEPRSAPGIAWSAGTLLRLGVGLLGARITVEQLAGLGTATAALIAGGVATTLLVGLLGARLLALPRSLGVLAGGASAICGASAALALAAVLPRHQRSEREVLTVVVLATLLSTIAMLLYPLLARALALPPQAAGLFVGGSIHDVAQVVVAGYALGQPTGDTAMLVKLMRVALLTLVVAAVALAVARGGRIEAPGKRPPPLLWFLGLFASLVTLRSLGLLPTAAVTLLDNAARGCLLIGVCALGAKTSLPALARCGWRPVVLMVGCALWIAGWMLAAALGRG